jgi:hypothetical protein
LAGAAARAGARATTRRSKNDIHRMVLAAMEIRATIELMRRSYWPVI